jgi:hypothetical protein
MRKSVLSLEDNNVNQIPNSDDVNILPSELGDELLVTQEDVSEATELQNLVEDAQTSNNALDAIQECSTDAGLTETEQSVLNVAQEHFLSKLGYKTVSMESIDKTVFTNKLDKNISIAQEGILSRLGSAIRRAFTTKKRILNNIQQDLELLSVKGSRDSNILEPGWGRVFSLNSKTLVKPDEVIKIISDLERFSKDTNLISAIKDLGKLTIRLESEINKGTFIADDGAVKEINEMLPDVLQFEDRIDKIIQTDTSIKYDPNFEPLNINQAKKIADKVQDILTNNQLNSEIGKLNDILAQYNLSLLYNNMLRLKSSIGIPAADIKAASVAISVINRCINKIFGISLSIDKACYSSMRYIRDSVSK